jgi:hypothetical protein
MSNKYRGYLTGLQMKEAAQRNVEIVHCNCNIPFWVGNGLHAFSGKLGESYAMQFEILVTLHNCKYGKVCSTM